MDVTPLVKAGQQIIQSYANGKFRISGESYDSAVFVMPSGTQIWDTKATEIDQLTEQDFSTLIAQANDLDVVLLGCGAEIAFLDKALKQKLSDHGLPVEVMDTGAACRTYNVLMAEGRRVAAALLPF
ncbi:MAG: Mth938-like domain-containing protein [Pseudomonadota bacterium]